MASRLLNVRLDGDRVRKARKLREAGVTLSDLVREAIDARFEAIERPMTGRGAATAVAQILEMFPDQAGAKERKYDVHDASASRAAVRRIVTRRAR